MNTDDKQISEALISLGWTPPASEKPEWIVSNNGEIGLKLGDRCIFMDNGKCVEYSDGRYENGDAVFYRPMKKTEFISINDTEPDSHSWSKFNYLTSLLKRG